MNPLPRTLFKTLLTSAALCAAAATFSPAQAELDIISSRPRSRPPSKPTIPNSTQLYKDNPRPSGSRLPGSEDRKPNSRPKCARLVSR